MSNASTLLVGAWHAELLFVHPRLESETRHAGERTSTEKPRTRVGAVTLLPRVSVSSPPDGPEGFAPTIPAHPGRGRRGAEEPHRRPAAASSRARRTRFSTRTSRPEPSTTATTNRRSGCRRVFASRSAARSPNALASSMSSRRAVSAAARPARDVWCDRRVEHTRIFVPLMWAPAKVSPWSQS